MGAEYSCDFIADPELKMSDTEIGLAAEEKYEEAAYENGHGGYSGTFAEHIGEGVRIHREKQFENAHEAWNYISESLDDDKWAAPHAVPVVGKGWAIGGYCSS